jgi:hypothetical protein
VQKGSICQPLAAYIRGPTDSAARTTGPGGGRGGGAGCHLQYRSNLYVLSHLAKLALGVRAGWVGALE